jgi:hypothetical protein
MFIANNIYGSEIDAEEYLLVGHSNGMLKWNI